MAELGSSEMTYGEVPIWLFLGLNVLWEPENLLVKASLKNLSLFYPALSQNLRINQAGKDL